MTNVTSVMSATHSETRGSLAQREPRASGTPGASPGLSLDLELGAAHKDSFKQSRGPQPGSLSTATSSPGTGRSGAAGAPTPGSASQGSASRVSFQAQPSVGTPAGAQPPGIPAQLPYSATAPLPEQAGLKSSKSPRAVTMGEFSQK